MRGKARAASIVRCSRDSEDSTLGAKLRCCSSSRPTRLERDRSHSRFRQAVHRIARPGHGAALLLTREATDELITVMSPSASSSSLESLIHALIPLSRSDQVLFNDILAHCKDVLSRLATVCTWPSFLLTQQLQIRSHIGQSRERDIGHLADIVKRRRTH